MFLKYENSNNYNMLFLYINKIIFDLSKLIYIILYINLFSLNKIFGSVYIIIGATRIGFFGLIRVFFWIETWYCPLLYPVETN